MLRFEIKKVFSKTMNKIVFAALIAVSLTAAVLAVRDVRYVTENGAVITGFEAGKQLRERKNQWRGALSEDVLRKVLKENRVINETEKEEDTAFAKKQGFADIREMITMAFCRVHEYDYYRADQISEEEIEGFYQRRTAELREYLSSKEVKNAFTDQEKAFLISQYEQLKTPLYYEYADGWKAVLESNYLPTLMTIVVVLLGFMTAGIFSDEFQYKADAVFFSARLGRNKAVAAKIKAGFVIVTVLYWVSMLLYSMVVLLTVGNGGGSCLIQTGSDNWRSFYNITYIQEWLFTMTGGYIGMLFVLALAMFVSVKCRSTVIATTIPFILSCIPMFLGRVSLFSGIATFTPDQLLRINKNLEDFTLVTIGGKVMGYISFLVLLYLILYVVLVPVIYYGYKKSEVK